MDMLENKGTQKRRMPKVGAMVLAAALAVGCVLSIAAGLPARVYNFVAGGTLTVLPGTDQVSMTIDGEEAAPIKLEDGRLWFEADGQRVDITDQVDENTPYIHEHTDPATGEKGYVIVGGTPEDFGWVEFIDMDGGVAMSGNNYDTVSIAELYEAQESQEEAHGGNFRVVNQGDHRPWFQAALDQLGLEW